MSNHTNPRRQARRHAAAVRKVAGQVGQVTGNNGTYAFATCDGCFGTALVLNGLCLTCSTAAQK